MITSPSGKKYFWDIYIPSLLHQMSAFSGGSKRDLRALKTDKAGEAGNNRTLQLPSSLHLGRKNYAAQGRNPLLIGVKASQVPADRLGPARDALGKIKKRDRNIKQKRKQEIIIRREIRSIKDLGRIKQRTRAAKRAQEIRNEALAAQMQNMWRLKKPIPKTVK